MAMEGERTEISTGFSSRPSAFEDEMKRREDSPATGGWWCVGERWKLSCKYPGRYSSFQLCFFEPKVTCAEYSSDRVEVGTQSLIYSSTTPYLTTLRMMVETVCRASIVMLSLPI